MLASNNLLIGMSVDRYFAVAVPLKFVKTGKILTTSENNNDWFLHNKRYSLLLRIDTWDQPLHWYALVANVVLTMT